MTARIPLVDLRWQHAEVAGEVSAGLAQVMGSGAFILGPAVRAFEEEFARACGRRHCVGLASGTDAIELSLRAAGVGEGDEVLLPANTFVATASAVIRAGAVPRLVDCDPVHHLLDPDDLPRRITARARALIPVHLYGQIAAMERIAATAAEHSLVIVEDAAQCQGATRHGQGPGSWGVAAATSFYPGKNLGAYGDAGAVVTDDEGLRDRLRLLRDHGSPAKYQHSVLGFNSRLDSMQAVVLSAKLRRLDAWNAMRRDAAARYDEMLAGVDGMTLPSTLEGNVHVWHLYVVRVPDRDGVLERLRDAGVDAGIHYPVPVHLQPAMDALGYSAGAFPVAEAAAAEILSLPIYPGITAEQQERVATALLRALP